MVTIVSNSNSLSRRYWTVMFTHRHSLELCSCYASRMLFKWLNTGYTNLVIIELCVCMYFFTQLYTRIYSCAVPGHCLQCQGYLSKCKMLSHNLWTFRVLAFSQYVNTVYWSCEHNMPIMWKQCTDHVNTIYRSCEHNIQYNKKTNVGLCLVKVAKVCRLNVAML